MLALVLQSILGASLAKWPTEICKRMWPTETHEGDEIVLMNYWRDLLECLAFSAGSKINICLRKQLWEMLLFEKHLLMEQTFDVEIYT